MSGNGKGRRPLVAEKRGSTVRKRKSPQKQGKPSTTTARKRTRRGRKASWKPTTLGGWIVFPFVFIARLLWSVSWRLGFAAAFVLACVVLLYSTTMPPVQEIVDARTRGSVTMLDREGEIFAWRGDQFGGMITAGSVSRHLHNAVVATEDKRFYRHFGISPRGIASAVRINMAEGRGPLSGNGGSTITQQTAKLLCLGVEYDPREWESEAAYEADCRRTTLWRKAKEAIFAMAMEVAYSKEEILTIYLNRAYLGAGSRGFEAAAQRYFGISAAQVNPPQAAMLAGLLKAPSTYAPTGNIARAQGRANVVIDLMQEQGYLTSQQAADAKRYPATLSENARADSGGFFADWVMESGPEFFTKDTTEDVVIRTTLDQRIQAAAENALVSVFENDVREGSTAQAAIVVMSADGAVRAMVGGRNLSANGAFNRATQALRQTGSSFKPFVYAAALDMGMSPNDLVDDSEVCWNIPGSQRWCPKNYDRQFKGVITLSQALAESRNVPAVNISEEVGREAVRTVATQFGIESDLAAGPALALGVSEATLLEMTGAYAGILNGGSSVEPYGLTELRLQGSDELLMEQTGGIGERVISQRAAQQLTYMMWRVVEEGTGTRARIPGWQIAGKSGTTQAARDAWFIAFTGDYVTGVWMGYDDNTPLAGVTGGGLPAEIWRVAMEPVLAGRAPVALPMQAPEPRVAQPAQTQQRQAPVVQGRGGDVIDDAILSIIDAILNSQFN